MSSLTHIIRVYESREKKLMGTSYYYPSFSHLIALTACGKENSRGKIQGHPYGYAYFSLRSIKLIIYQCILKIIITHFFNNEVMKIATRSKFIFCQMGTEKILQKNVCSRQIVYCREQEGILALLMICFIRVSLNCLGLKRFASKVLLL